METTEIIRKIEAYEIKIEESLTLNKAILKNIQLEKSEKKIKSILVYRTIDLFLFAFLTLYLGNYVVTHWSETYLAISAIIVSVFALIALAGSIGQVALLQQIDFSKPLVDIRKKIELANTQNILFIKLILLSIPLWWSFSLVSPDVFLGFDLYTHLNDVFISWYLIFNTALAIPIIWLTNKLTYKNTHIGWVRKTIGLFSGTKTRKATEYLNEIEDLEGLTHL